MESIFKSPKQWLPAAVIAGLFAGFGAPVYSADMETLIDKLHEKGVLADDEYQEMRTEARAERREQALRDAQAEEKINKAMEENHLTGRFRDGFSWESADKKNAIALGGRVHADYRNYSGLVAADTFDIRRAYLTVSGKLQDYLTFDISGDFAQTTSPQLDVAWVNVALLDKALQARFGQFKMPFSMEEVGSSRFLDFQERSLVNALVPQKERGAMIWGTPSTGISYGLALSTGQGKNNNEVVAAKAKNDLIGRVTVNVAEILDRKDAVFHLGGAFSEGELPAISGLTQRTEARGITFFNTAAFTGQDVKRSRFGAEVALAWGPVKLQAEYVDANFKGTSATGADYDRDIRANYIEALWLVTGERYADAYRAGTIGTEQVDLVAKIYILNDRVREALIEFQADLLVLATECDYPVFEDVLRRWAR